MIFKPFSRISKTFWIFAEMIASDPSYIRCKSVNSFSKFYSKYTFWSYFPVIGSEIKCWIANGNLNNNKNNEFLYYFFLIQNDNFFGKIGLQVKKINFKNLDIELNFKYFIFLNKRTQIIFYSSSAGTATNKRKIAFIFI